MNTYMRNALPLLLAAVMCLWGTPRALAATDAPPRVNVNQLLDMVTMNKGKVVVLNFFATWCPPCREEIPGLVALAKAYPADKVVVIGISVDQDTAKVPPFVKQMGINYPVFLAGPDVPPLYGVRTIPHNVVYDQQGTLTANAPGYVAQEDLKEFIDTLLEQKKK